MARKANSQRNVTPAPAAIRGAGRPIAHDAAPSQVRTITEQCEIVDRLINTYEFHRKVRAAHDRIVELKRETLHDQLLGTILNRLEIERTVATMVASWREGFKNDVIQFTCFMLGTVEDDQEWQVYLLLDGVHDVKKENGELDDRALIVLFCRWMVMAIAAELARELGRPQELQKFKKSGMTIAAEVLDVNRGTLDSWGWDVKRNMRDEASAVGKTFSSSLEKALGVGPFVPFDIPEHPRARSSRAPKRIAMAVGACVALGGMGVEINHCLRDETSPLADTRSAGSAHARIGAAASSDDTTHPTSIRRTEASTRSTDARDVPVQSPASARKEAPLASAARSAQILSPAEVADLNNWFKWSAPQPQSPGPDFGGIKIHGVESDGTLRVEAIEGSSTMISSFTWSCTGAADPAAVLVRCSRGGAVEAQATELLLLGWREEQLGCRRVSGDAWKIERGELIPFRDWAVLDLGCLAGSVAAMSTRHERIVQDRPNVFDSASWYVYDTGPAAADYTRICATHRSAAYCTGFTPFFPESQSDRENQQNRSDRLGLLLSSEPYSP